MIEREMGGPQGDHPHSPRRVYASLLPAVTRSRFPSILLYCHTSGGWLLEEMQWKWFSPSMFLFSNQSAPSSLPLKRNIEEAFIRKGRRCPLLLGNHKKKSLQAQLESLLARFSQKPSCSCKVLCVAITEMHGGRIEGLPHPSTPLFHPLSMLFKPQMNGVLRPICLLFIYFIYLLSIYLWRQGFSV